MKIGLTGRQRMVLVVVCFIVAIIGFMVKLPSAFRHMDKELHATFYFLAAAFLNILWAQKKLVRHALIFGALYLFGIAIEYAQAYSNSFFRKRIHGRFDPEDVQSNLRGLLLFSLLWIITMVVLGIYNKWRLNNTEYKPTKE